jgi:RimJ/RimL family protein N-acetyltransferase
MPIIRTERLSLREFNASDFDELYAMFNDPLVMRYYPAHKNRLETQMWLDRAAQSYETGGHGMWAVEFNETGLFAGQCGLIPQVVDGIEEVEIGYLFKSCYWHHGYATEAAAACRDYGFDALKKDSLISLIRPENMPSRRVAERVGMTIEKKTMHHNIEHFVYRIKRPLQL